tara:strand:+ start:1384 stop:1596 length:213 start_codon:yes stop_codon:yes gene_type:complete
MEVLDCKNIIEINAIRELLTLKPQLLKVFDDIIKVANIRLNDERHCVSLPIEVNTEPDLSDHSSDESEPL